MNADSTVKVTVEKGEDRCSCCGAYIRNIVRINEVPFGTKCAEGFLPRNPDVKKAVKNFKAALEAQKIAQVNALRQIMLDLAYTDLPAPLQNKNNAFYADFVTRRPNSPYIANVTMILAARALQ